MKVFVTGGAGFIGSHLVDVLVEEDNEVTVYDNLSSGRKEFIPHRFDKPSFRFIKGDLLDLDKLKETVKYHELIFHLAANPEIRWGIENTRLDLDQETIATYNVLEAMRVNRIKKVVFSSSSVIYGETPMIPLPEDYGPLLPISLYGAAKLACEGLISAFCHTFKMQGWIFRFANVVGRRATHGVIFDFINKLRKSPNELEILGSGNQRKPYLYVKDCVEGILFGLQNSKDIVNLFNLGSNTSTNVTTIAKILVKEIGFRNVKFSYTGGDRGWPGDVPQVRFNVDRINRLGWQAKFTSDEAVKKAVRENVQEQYQ